MRQCAVTPASTQLLAPLSLLLVLAALAGGCSLSMLYDPALRHSTLPYHYSVPFLSCKYKRLVACLVLPAAPLQVAAA